MPFISEFSVQVAIKKLSLIVIIFCVVNDRKTGNYPTNI